VPKPAPRTGPFAAQLLSTGLAVLGKSRLPEFGFNASTEFMSAEPTRNPWHPDYSSGASSGGAAALVAAGVVPIAHANDGGGSIRIPAACCGLVGLKPSRGRHLDGDQARALPIKIISAGVVTRSVRDTATFFAAADRRAVHPGLLALLGVAGVPGQRVRQTDVRPVVRPGKLDRLSSGLRRLYRRELLRTPSTLLRLSRVKQAYATMFLRHEVVLSPVLAHVTPAIGVLSPRQPFDELLDRLTRYVAFTPLNNVAGSPAISLPTGATAGGLPIGVQLSAAYGDERTLLELAFALEQARPWRRIQD
jgi:amidase